MKAILFDLDGTLLPMDSKIFEKLYFKSLTDYFQDLMPREKLFECVWASTKKMLLNDGKMNNKSVFEEDFINFVEDIELYMNRFMKYYETDFESVKASTKEEPLVSDVVRILKKKGYRLILATNPLFPLKAVEKRIEWAGLDKEDFDHVTHYDISTSCKPNLSYYEEILDKMNIKADECYMIGNDVEEDMIASELGMKTFLVTPNMIKRSDQNKNWNYEGNYLDLYNWASQLSEAD